MTGALPENFLGKWMLDGNESSAGACPATAAIPPVAVAVNVERASLASAGQARPFIFPSLCR